MVNFFAIIVGFIITLTGYLNASLAEYIGMPLTLVTLHSIAAIFGVILVFREKKGFGIKTDLPPYFYFGGAIGFFVSFLNSVCMVNIGASLSIAIIIFGQMTTSCIIDNFGLFNMPVRKFSKEKVLVLFIITIGIVCMYFGN